MSTAQDTGPPSPASVAASGGPERPARRRDEIGAAGRSGALNLAGAGVSAVFGLLLILVVTRMFSEEVAGVFFVAMSVFLIAGSVAGIGAGVGAVYMLARRRAQGDPAGLRAVFRVAVPPVVVAGVVVAVVVWLAAPWLASRLVQGADETTVLALRVVAVFVPVSALFHLFVSAIRGLGRTRPFVLIERIARPSLHLMAVAAVGLTAATGAGAVSAAWAAPYLVVTGAAVVSAVRLRRRLERAAGVTSPAAPTRADWTGFWRFAAPRGGTAVAQVVLQRVDVVLVGTLLGPVPVALYVAASRFLVMGQLANQSLGFATQHRFAAMFATGELAGARRLYQTTTAWLILSAWPFFLLSIVFAEPVLAVLFGDQYQSAASVLRVLSGVMLLASACGMVSMVLEMSGRSISVLVQTLVALAVNVGLNLALIPRIGLVGCAFAWAGAIALNNLIPFAQLYRSYRLHPIGAGAVVAMVSAVGCFGAVPGIAAALFGPEPIVLLVSAVIGTAGYAVMLWRARGVLELRALLALRHRAT